MRITVDIDENDMLKIQEATGIRKRSPAIRRAVVDYVRELEKRRFLMKVRERKTDYGMTNEELEKLGTYDPH
jgi:hypothetical protein